MASPLFCTPNYLKSTFHTPLLGGGDWDVDNWLDNVNDNFFINEAISTDAALTSTIFDVDLAVLRDVKAFVIPNSNVDNDGMIRVRGSNAAAWIGVTVDGVNAINATTLNITAGAAGATITAGEIFKITGDTQMYHVVTGTALGASASGSITIERTGDSGTGLTAATTGGEAITCHSGDYSGALIADTGSLDYRPIIYGDDALWGSPTIWTGKETAENIATLNFPNPFIHVFASVVLARYWRVEIDNTTNDDGFVSISDCFIASGFEPTSGIQWGATIGVSSNTTRESSAGGVDAFDIEKSSRFVDMTLPGLSVSESMTSVFDMQRKLDINDDFFFIFDQNDTILMNRRAFAARFESIRGQQFVAYEWTDSHLRIKEKLA